MKLRAFLFVSLLLLCVPAAKADGYTYTYTGNAFTTIAGPFTSSDSITGSITLSSAIPADTGNFSTGFMGPTTLPVVITGITSFSFTDGVDTFDGSNVAYPILNFATDDNGNIIAWQVDLMLTDGAEVFFSYQNPAGFGFSGNDGAQDTGGTDYAGNSAPGAWVLTAPSVTPEPGTLTLLGTGLAGFGEMTRRKLRRQ